LQSKTSAANEILYGLIDSQLSLVPQLADFTIISMLKMIAKVGYLEKLYLSTKRNLSDYMEPPPS
jgi:hypothetical protein